MGDVPGKMSYFLSLNQLTSPYIAESTMLKPMIPYENSANTFGIDPFILTQIIGTKRDPERDNLAQARIQVFLGARTPPPPYGCLQYFFYIQTHRC